MADALTKKSLAEKVAEETGLTLNKSNEVITTVFNTIKDTLTDGGSVELLGFGKFSVKHVEARSAMNLHTKEKIEVPAHDTPVFKFSKALKDAVK